MGFDDAVEGALDILHRRRRVSYGALKRQFGPKREQAEDWLGGGDIERLR